MNNKTFVSKLLDIANNHKTLYVMGCFGAPMTNTNKIRYTQNHEYNKEARRREMILSASADTFGFDCVCLIKAVLWRWNGDKSKMYGGATYCNSCIPDFSINTLLHTCGDVSDDMTNIEVGEILFIKTSHVGVYVGDGKVVECTPAWKNGVQVTKITSRKWEKHGKCCYVEYGENTFTEFEMPKKSNEEIANEVIKGLWGNGAERVTRLLTAGYNYRAIQDIVNKKLK